MRATAKAPTSVKGDLSIDQIPVDKTTKDKLRRIGVTTVGDLKQVEQHHVDLKQVTGDDVDYTSLANQIGKPFARNGAHASAQFLDQAKANCDGDKDPE